MRDQREQKVLFISYCKEATKHPGEGTQGSRLRRISTYASALILAQHPMQLQLVSIKNEISHTLNPRFLQAFLFYTQLSAEPSIL